MSYPITIDSAGGEYMETVVIVEWAVALGEAVRAGDVVVTVETAKAATEIEASHDGYLTEILYPVGSEAPVGAVLGRIGDSKEAVSTPAEATAENAVAGNEDATGPKPAQTAGARVVASPLARRLAKAAGIDLTAVRGSGPKGRIKQRDSEAAVAAGGTAMKDAAPRAAAVTGAQASTPTKATDLPPIVLLHGFGADRFAWRWVAPLLDCANRVVTLELPGHG
jgi:pyruvate dehydrogenase E2 component (dihydrolipoamide acetyltransferase)